MTSPKLRLSKVYLEFFVFFNKQELYLKFYFRIKYSTDYRLKRIEFRN